jgi:hypothetical protein
MNMRNLLFKTILMLMLLFGVTAMFAANIFTEGFETGNTSGVAPVGWTCDASGFYAGTGSMSYSRTPHSGSWYVYQTYNTSKWMYKQVSLTIGVTYTLSLWAKQDYTSGCQIKAMAGTSATSAGMTSSIIALSNVGSTYTQYTGTFVPSSTGTYYIGIYGTLTYDPWYMTVDDITLDSPSITPPNPATSFNPADLATGVSINPTLTWASGGGGPTGYHVYFGASSPATLITPDVTVPSYTPTGPLLYSHTYYWKIIPFNGNGPATGCTEISFTTMADPAWTSLPRSQNFDSGLTPPALPGGWTALNVNADAYTWITGPTIPNSSPNSLYIRWNGSAAMNDWVFTPAVSLTAGISYTFEYKYNTGGGYTEKLAFAYGNAPSVAGMTTPLWSADITNTAYITRKEVIIPETTGTYYFGWHAFSAADTYYIILDDISMYVTPPTPNPAVLVSPFDGGSTWGSVVLNWSAGVTPPAVSTYRVLFAAHTPLVDPTDQVQNTSATSYPAGALANGTYYWKIIPHNGDGDATGCPTWSFTVINDPTVISFPYSESFDATFPPPGWANIATVNEYVWEQVTVGSNPTCSPNTGADMLMFNSFDAPVGSFAILASPPLTLPGNDYQVSFWFYRSADWTNHDLVNVYLNTAQNLSGTPTLLGTVNRYLTYDPVVASVGWYKYTFNFPTGSAGAGHYVIFEADGEYGDNMFLDDVSVKQQPALPLPAICVSPLDTAIDVELNATLNWSADPAGPAPTGYNLYFGTELDPVLYADKKDLLTATTYDPAAVTTLVYGVKYVWKIVPYVGDTATGEITGCVAWTFTTMNDPTITPPYLQAFESVIPPGWLNIVPEGGIQFVCATNYFHNGAAAGVFPAQAFTGQLITPEIVLDSDGYQFGLWIYRRDLYFTTYGTTPVFNLYTNTTPSVTGATLKGSISADYTQSPAVSAEGWYKYSYTFGVGSTGSQYIIIEVVSDDGWNAWFDDLTIDLVPTVVLPALIGSPANGAIDVPINASLNWAPDGDGAAPTGYKLYFGSNGGGITDPTDLVPGTEQGLVTTYSGPLLDYSKTYYWKIVPHLGVTDAIGCVIWSFTTMADPTVTAPYSQDFDGTFPPAGWTNLKTAGTGTGLWITATVGVNPDCNPHNSSVAMAEFNSYGFSTGTKGILVTPPMILDASNYGVTFWLYRNASEYYYDNLDLVNVYFNTSPDLSGTPVLLGTVNRDVSQAPIVALPGWYSYTYDFPGGSAGSGKYVIFEGVSAWGDNIFLDDVSIHVILLPDVPVGLSISAVPTGIKLDWTASANATSYRIYSSKDPEALDWGLPLTEVLTNSYVDASGDTLKFFKVSAVDGLKSTNGSSTIVRATKHPNYTRKMNQKIEARRVEQPLVLTQPFINTSHKATLRK